MSLNKKSIEYKLLEELDLTSEEKKGAEKLIKATEPYKDVNEMLSKISYNAKGIKNELTDTELDTLTSIMSEYLDTFMLIGYDMSGNRICNWRFPNKMAMDAMLVQIRDMIPLCETIAQSDLNSILNGDNEEDEDYE